MYHPSAKCILPPRPIFREREGHVVNASSAAIASSACLGAIAANCALNAAFPALQPRVSVHRDPFGAMNPGRALLSFAALALAVCTLAWLAPAQSSVYAAGCGAATGGAASNWWRAMVRSSVINPLRLGRVAFNLADVFILTGMLAAGFVLLASPGA